MTWEQFLRPEVLVFLIPLSAIVGTSATVLAKMYFSHQERIEMIRQGINPDENTTVESATESNEVVHR